MSRMAALSQVEPIETRSVLPGGVTLSNVISVVINSTTRPELARLTGYSEAQLARWQTDPDNYSGKHRPLPATAIEPISRATGDPAIVRYLAGRLGYLLIPMPSLLRASRALAHEAMCLALAVAELGRLLIWESARQAEVAERIAGRTVALCDRVIAHALALKAMADAPSRKPLARITR